VTRRSKGALYDAREQSLAIDPDYARAAEMLSRSHIYSYTQPFDGDYLAPVTRPSRRQSQFIVAAYRP
jgi:hypothetical protein